MLVELADEPRRHRAVPPPIPFVQAAARRRARVLGIHRQQDDLVHLRGAQLRDGLLGERVPVAHRDDADSVDAAGAQLRFQRARLLLGEPADGRGSADDGVVMLHLARARGRDQLGQRLAPQAREREIDDVGVGEEVEKKGLDSRQAIGTAKLEEHHADPTFVFRHLGRNPSERGSVMNVTACRQIL
jgi:hypothetical protein